MESWNSENKFSFGIKFNDFPEMVDKSIDEFLNANRSKETIYHNMSSVNRLQSFMEKELNPPEKRSFWELPAATLDRILCQFFMKAKKTNEHSIKTLGELYQPNTLTSFRNAWQRVLSEKKSKYDLKKDNDFETSRKVLAARRKQLTQQGLGNKPMSTRPLTNTEINYLFQSGYFGTKNALTLQRAMWWKVTTNFGYRARNESRKLCFGDIILSCDTNGVRYLEWNKERGSKTRTGEKSNSHQRAFNPRAYETGGDQCPVGIYEHFVKRRPIESKTDNSPFFLAMVPEQKLQDDEPWFFNRPLGKNLLGQFLSKATNLLQTGSSTSRSKVSNHSARKTTITTLLDNNVNPLHVSQLSGHKNVESLKSYHTASLQQQQSMSNLINNLQSQPSSLLHVVPTKSNDNSLQEKNTKDQFLGSTFQGATITQCVFNVNISQNFSAQNKRKRLRVIDSDEE